MSGQQQQSQKMRRNNLSPKQGGPLKATVPLSLMHQTCSPTRCLCQKSSPSNSPTHNAATASPLAVETKIKNRNSPDCRISPESPTTGKVEGKSKVFAMPVNTSSYIRRTASVDTIYLLGQWQRDALYLSYCGRLMMDRATQTPDEFEELENKKPQKKNSTATNETLEMKYIRQRLQRTNLSNRGAGPSGTYQRHSPVHGDHSAISPATGGGNTSPVVPSSTVSPNRQLSFYNNNPAAANNNNNFVAASSSNGNNASATYSSFAAASNCARALPIPIPDIPKPLIPRMRSSVEGLNQEIERLVLREIASMEGSESERTLNPTPDGHRAPIADLFRTTHSVDTQTPFSRRDSYPSSNSPTSRSSSISPVVPIIPGHMDTSRPSSTEDNGLSRSPDGDGLNKLATSPHINKFLAREPPDGCEKVKIAEEMRNSARPIDTQIYRCPKPSVNFVLLPSQSSAFYPLCKNCVMTTSDDSSVECNSVAALSTTEKQLQ